MAEQAIALSAARPRPRGLAALRPIAGGVTALRPGTAVPTPPASSEQSWPAAARTTRPDVWTHGHLGLAWVAMFHGDFAAASTAVDRARAAAQRSGAESGSIQAVEPVAQCVLGWISWPRGPGPGQAEPGRGGRRLPRIVAGWAALPLVILARAQLALGELDHAAASLDEATALARPGCADPGAGRAGSSGPGARRP